MRLSLAALVLVLSAGCVTAMQPVVRLPATDEAMACSRQCMFLTQNCSANVTNVYGVTGDPWSTMAARNQCNAQHSQCLQTCPGACVQSSPEGGCYDAFGRNMLAPPPRQAQPASAESEALGPFNPAQM